MIANPICRDSIKKADLDECFSERFTERSNEGDNELRHLEIHLSEGKFQSESSVVARKLNFFPSHRITFSLSSHEGVESVRFFVCKKLRYIWDVESLSFTKLKGLDVDVPSMTIHKQQAVSSFTRNIR